MSQISWTDQANVVQAIDPDAVLSEQHSSEADITDDPVEEGANTTDSVRRKARTIGLELFFTDGTERGRCERILSQFETFQKDGTRLRIDLGGVHSFGRTYRSMAVASVRVLRSAKDRESLTLSVSFKEIRVVGSEIVAVQVAREPKGQPKVTGGDQNPVPTNDDRYTSNLFKIFSLTEAQ